MATIDWPTFDAFKPTDFVVGLSAPGTSWSPPYGGILQTVSNLNDRLTARMSLAPLIDASAAGQREAFLFGVKSAGDIVRAHHFARPYPNGTLRGSPTVNGAHAAGVRSIVLASCFGANVLTGSSFEIDTNADGLANGWTAYSSGTTGSITYARPNTSATHGTYKQRVSASGLGSATSDRAGFYQTATVSPSTGYVFSVYAGNATGNAKVRLHIDWFTAGSSFISSSTSTQFSPVGATLTRQSFTATSPSTAAFGLAHVWIEANTGGPSAVLMDFDAAMLEVGSTPSTFPQYATLIGGDMLGIGGNLVQVAYAGATADDVGAMTVPLSLATLEAISGGAAVTWSKPVGEWQIVGVDPQLTYQPGILQLGPEVILIQA